MGSTISSKCCCGTCGEHYFKHIWPYFDRILTWNLLSTFCVFGALVAMGSCCGSYGPHVLQKLVLRHMQGAGAHKCRHHSARRAGVWCARPERASSLVGSEKAGPLDLGAWLALFARLLFLGRDRMMSFPLAIALGQRPPFVLRSRPVLPRALGATPP